MELEQLKNKKILILGMARSGLATARFFNEKGYDVIISDIKQNAQLQEEINEMKKIGVNYYVGGHPLELLENVGLVVPSPGIPLEIPIIQSARQQGIPVLGELELGYTITKSKVIAITGTNGKTTTTTLIGEILKNDGKNAAIAGNIGLPVIQIGDKRPVGSYLVIEVSSFQLETIETFRPFISVILNITQDHLNRHGSFENYIKAKYRIFENQQTVDYTVVNVDDPLLKDVPSLTEANTVLFSRTKELERGVFVRNGVVVVSDGSRVHAVCKVKDIAIKGSHNLENVLAAVAVAWLCKTNFNSLAETLKSFQGVEHRLEYVDNVNGVRFINDSKGTNPDAASKAIEAIEQPIILIAGGYDKGGDFDGFVKTFGDRVKGMVVIGQTAEKIAMVAESIGLKSIKRANDMGEAVITAYDMAKPGYCVLLSPACASWDMFNDFEHRGRVFKQAVKGLR
jgi:UDP-N-acetylmuramoylalanine--D-glutamate ligase